MISIEVKNIIDQKVLGMQHNYMYTYIYIYIFKSQLCFKYFEGERVSWLKDKVIGNRSKTDVESRHAWMVDVCLILARCWSYFSSKIHNN